MATPPQPSPTRTGVVQRVRSRDGTGIRYVSSGEGPPLVVVHGATADHTRWAPLLPYLEPHVTVHAIDRRGRGASGDHADYEGTREFEDIAAVVDAVAARTGGPVDLLGHSFGGFCALGAAALTSNVRRLILYEGAPAVGEEAFTLPPGVRERMERAMARGEAERALEIFFREVVEMPDHEFETYSALPAWQARVGAAHTLTRELDALRDDRFDPARAARVEVPTLLLLGGDSPDWVRAEVETVAAALPDSRIVVLEGQQHIAMDLVPEVFAGHVLGFLRDA